MRLTTEQQDALTEMVNIGSGRAAAALSELCGERVEIAVPSLLVCGLPELRACLATETDLLDTLVFQDFGGDLAGRAVLAFSRKSSLRIGQLLGHIGCLPEECDLDLQGILIEVCNLVLNGVLGTIGNVAKTRLRCSLPELTVVVDPVLVLAEYLAETRAADHRVFLANVHFTVARRDIKGSIIVLFECDGLIHLLDSVLVESVADR
jgi:chemotaxis protein CheC